MLGICWTRCVILHVKPGSSRTKSGLKRSEASNMADFEFQQLYNELKNSQSVSENYGQFLDAMSALNTEMEDLMQPDENTCR